MKKLLTGVFVVVGLAVLPMSSCGGDDEVGEKCVALQALCDACTNTVASDACDVIAKKTGDTANDACGVQATMDLYAATSTGCSAANP